MDYGSKTRQSHCPSCNSELSIGRYYTACRPLRSYVYYLSKYYELIDTMLQLAR